MVTRAEKEKRIEELNKVIDEQVLNDDEKDKLLEMNYAEQLAQDKIKANNGQFLEDAVKANVPFMRTKGINGMLDGVKVDGEIRKEQQGVVDERSEMRKKALDRYTQATGQTADDILKANGYDEKERNGYTYG